MIGINFTNTVIPRIIQISITFDDNSYVVTLCSFATCNAKFLLSAGIISSGNTYVCDYDNNNMQKFHFNRIFILKWEPIGIGKFIFFASIIGTNSVDNLYKYDSRNIGVEKFTP